MEACAGVAAQGASAPLDEQARHVLASTRRPRSLGETTDENIHLTEDLWAARSSGCAAGDQALTRVLARL